MGAKAGITKRVHLHSWQQAFAVELEAPGTPVTTISKLLEHSSVAVTAQYLTHRILGQAVATGQNVCKHRSITKAAAASSWAVVRCFPRGMLTRCLYALASRSE